LNTAACFDYGTTGGIYAGSWGSTGYTGQDYITMWVDNVEVRKNP